MQHIQIYAHNQSNLCLTVFSHLSVSFPQCQWFLCSPILFYNQVWFKNRRAKERKDAKTKSEEGQPDLFDKKDEEIKKEPLESSKAKAEIRSQKSETEKKLERPGKEDADKRDENARQKHVENHLEKESIENKPRKASELIQKSLQTTPFSTTKMPFNEIRKSEVREDECGYSSIFSPRSMSLKHFSKSYLSHIGAHDGMSNSVESPIVKQKWECERSSVQESSSAVLSGSSHFQMTRVSSAVLPHYSDYANQSVHHTNTETVYEYPTSYPYRSFIQRHSSQ